MAKTITTKDTEADIIAAPKRESVWDTLSRINCNGHTEQKNGLTYLSWAWAWSEVKKNYPRAYYTIYERPDGCPYWTDGKTCWVKTGVTIECLEHIEYLPVMNNRNQSIPLASVTSMDMNKAIQRSLTKACARHGLGIYIYAGEDLPEGEIELHYAQACEEVRAAKTADEVVTIFHKYPTFKDDAAFKALCRSRTEELKHIDDTDNQNTNN